MMQNNAMKKKYFDKAMHKTYITFSVPETMLVEHLTHFFRNFVATASSQQTGNVGRARHHYMYVILCAQQLYMHLPQ